jgi:hypothetical protein
VISPISYWWLALLNPEKGSGIPFESRRYLMLQNNTRTISYRFVIESLKHDVGFKMMMNDVPIRWPGASVEQAFDQWG